MQGNHNMTVEVIIKKLKEERMKEFTSRRWNRKMMEGAKEDVKEIDEKINNLRTEELRVKKIISSLEKLVIIEKKVGFKGGLDISYISHCSFEECKELEHGRYDVERQETILTVEKLGKIEKEIEKMKKHGYDEKLSRRMEKEKNIVIDEIKNLGREAGSEEKLNKYKARIEEIKKELEKLDRDRLYPEYIYYLKRYELCEMAISPFIIEAVDKLCKEDSSYKEVH